MNQLKSWKRSYRVQYLRRDADRGRSRRHSVVAHSVVFHLEHGDYLDRLQPALSNL